MITVELTETEYRRIMSALNMVNDAPVSYNTTDVINSLKKSHDRFVRAKELQSTKYLVQQAYNKCKDISDSTDFVSTEEFNSLRRVVDSLSAAMGEIENATLFQKQVTVVKRRPE